MVTVVPASDGRWDAVLSPVPHDVFQTAGFHRFASTIEQGEPWLAVVGDAERGVAWPYLLRELTGVGGLGRNGRSRYRVPARIHRSCGLGRMCG